MSKIISLEGKNFKGINQIVELTGKDIFTGPCGSEKSARRQMFEFVSTGEISDFKESSNKHLFSLSSDPNNKEISVTLKTDKNFIFTRKVKRTVKPTDSGIDEIKFSTSFECFPSNGERTNTQYEQRLLEELGINKLMFSLNNFYKMTPNQKKTFIMSRSNMNYEDWTIDSIRKYLEEDMLTSELEINNEKRYKHFQEAIDYVLDKYSEEISFEDNCHSIFNIAVSKTSEWKKGEAKAKAATEKLTEIKNKVIETVRGITDLKERLGKEKDILIDQERKEQQNDSNIEFNINRNQKIEDLTLEIKDAEAMENPDDVDELKAKIESLKTVKPVIGSTEEYDNVIKKHSIEYQETEFNLVTASKERDRANELRESISSELSHMRLKTTGYYDVSINDLKKKCDNIDSNIEKFSCGKCPLMDSIKCTTDFSTIITALENDKKKYIQEIKVKEEEKKIHLDSIASKEQQFCDVDKELDDLKKSYNDLSDKLITLQHKIQNAESSIILVKDQYTKALEAYGKNEDKISKLKEKLNSAMTFDSRKEVYLKTKHEELDAANAVESKPVEQPEMLKEMKDATKKVIEELEEKIKSKEDAKRNLENQQSSMIDMKYAANMHMAYRKLVKLLGVEGIIGIVLTQGLGPVKDEITKNLEILGMPYEFYFDTAGTGKKSTFDFGIIDEIERRKSHEALSQGERLILTTAMITAFIDRTENVKCKVITIDNINDLDRHLLKRFIKGLSDLKYDNILLTGIVNDRIGEYDKKTDSYILPDEVDGFKVIGL